MFDVLRAQEVKIGDEQEVKPSTEACKQGGHVPWKGNELIPM